MRKLGLSGLMFLLAVSFAKGQVLPDPLPENNPDAHSLADLQYPSARVCGECHPNQYEQWSVSSHAYASLSPMFNQF
jgi:hypothetical protein